MAACLTAANLVWLEAHLDAHPPNWDRALYLYLSVRQLHALQDGGGRALLSEFVHGSDAVAPLVPLATLPGYTALSESRFAAHATTSLFLLLLLVATYGLGRQLDGAGTGLLAAFAVSCFPGIALASRDYLMDFPAAALATAAVAALVSSRFGERRGLTLAFGVLTGLTLLAKTMAAVFLVAPVAHALWQARTSRARLLRLGSALLLAVAVASVWWLPNHAAALRYLWIYGFSAESQPFAAGGTSLWSVRNLSFYPLAIVNEGIGPAFAVLLVAATLQSLRRRRAPDGLLLGWACVSLAILTLVPNKSGDRYILGLLPPLALSLAGAVSRLSRRSAAVSVSAIVLAGLYNRASLADLGLPRLFYRPSLGLTWHVPREPPHPWPIPALLDALVAGSRHDPPRDRPAGRSPTELVRNAYRLVLRREPDAAGMAAYIRNLESGSMTAEGLARSLIASAEFRKRRTRVLVATDNDFVNASVLRYYAERRRLPLAFEHPLRGPFDDLAERFDAAVVKRGGNQGPTHTTAQLDALLAELAGPRWRGPSGGLACPDGSTLELLVPGPDW